MVLSVFPVAEQIIGIENMSRSSYIHLPCTACLVKMIFVDLSGKSVYEVLAKTIVVTKLNLGHTQQAL